MSRETYRCGNVKRVTEIQPCRDPLANVFFGKLGYKVIYFWIACNVMFVLASLYYGTLTRIDLPFNPEVTLPLLKDKCFYIFFILGGCGIVLIDRVLKVVPSTFAGLWDNKILRSKTKMKNPVEVYNKQLKDVEKKMNSKKSYIYATGYTLFSISYTFIDYYRIPRTESPLIVFCDIRIFPLSGIVVYATYAILYFLVVIMIYKGVLLIHFLRKLHNTFDFHVRPLHPDKCGGLKPVGDFCIAINYIIFIFFVVFITYYAFPPGGELNVSLYFSLPLYIFFALFFFFYPLWPIHNSMKTQKSIFLSMLNRNLDPDYREMIDDIIDKGIDVSSRTMKKIGRIDRIHEPVQKMRIWPFKTVGLIWFLAAVFVPVLSVSTITFNVDELIRVFTAVFVPILYILVNVVLKGS